MFSARRARVDELRAFEATGLDHVMIHPVPGIHHGDLMTFMEACLPHLRCREPAFGS